MSTPNTIAIASDHAGFDLKETLKGELAALGYAAEDLGCYTKDSVDYPDVANAISAWIKGGDARRGVLICGSGIGVSIAANRHPGIRAALCHSAETAKLSRQHNNANILCLGARIIDELTAREALRAFLSTEFEGGRHQGRVEKLG